MSWGLCVLVGAWSHAVGDAAADETAMAGAVIGGERMKSNVRHDDGKVWIDGAKGFSSGEYASSVHGSQARILQLLGEPLDYDDLICYGAFAFRANVHEEMCPSAGHPFCGYMCVANSVRALPWTTRLFEALPWAEQKADRAAFEAEARAAIKDSIDRGVPVHYGSEEDGLIIGYADEGRRWLCVHPYHKNGEVDFWHDEVEGFAGGEWPWGIVVWTEPKAADQRASRRELTVAALKQAVEMWKTEKKEAYFCGDVEDPKSGMQGNGWCYDVLAHSRRIAGRWLGEAAKEFDGEAGEQLKVAADHYAAIAELTMKGLDSPWGLALPPARHEDWTSAMRQDQIKRLEAAREHDRAAIAAIEKALAAMTVPKQ